MSDNIDLGPVEDASAALFEARVLVTATEKFVNETRQWLNYAPERNESATRSLIDIDTMLGIVDSYVRTAKDTIDQFTKDEYARRKKVD